jgi:hypothetical protein
MWHPIETAPKDGTPVLVVCALAIERDEYLEVPDLVKRLAIAWWGDVTPHYGPRGVWVTAEVRSDYVENGPETGGSIERELVAIVPTHWLPIPKPPSNE